MEKTVSQVKQKKQQKNALAILIQEELDRRGWDFNRLAAESGVDRTSVWRFLSGTKVNVKTRNLIDMLNTLNLMPKSNSNHNIIPINHAKYDPGNADLHDALEEILKLNDTDARKTIEKLLEGLMSSIKERREQSRKIDAIYDALVKDREREP
jgi:transcriptional regulator with XRE-family HTH domain